MQTSAQIKLLALDLDGTLLTSDKRLTERTKKALISASENAEVVFVTGRPHGGLPEDLLSLPCARYIITSNGAVTIDLQTGKKLRSAFIDNAVMAEILRYPAELDLLYNVFIDGMGYSTPQVYEKLIRHFSGTPQESYVRQSRRPADNLLEFILQSEGVENFWIRAHNRRERDLLNEKIKAAGPLHTVLTAETDVEVGVPAAEKGAALKELSNALQIAEDHILAIGDNDNDLGMFRVAGTSVAMGNAPAEVKQAASFITVENDKEGAAYAIEQMLLS